MLQHDYLAITRGPLVYACPLIDGFKTEETVRLPHGAAGPGPGWLELLPPHAGQADGAGPAIRAKLAHRTPLVLDPYYCAGGRNDGAWRLTWLSVAPAVAASSTKIS